MTSRIENEAREETVAELQDALGELERGEGLSRFLGGHGIMSRLFEFKWSEPTLEIDFRLPYARVLGEEESQKEDAAEVGAAIRMAMLLLTVEGRKESPLEVSKVSVWADEKGVGYSLSDADGNMIESGDDWSGIVNRLEAALPEGGESLSIIWP